MFFTGGCFALLVFYFSAERLLLARRVRCIPLRICVTGTRGKSSVTRLIASSLREAGFMVLAKTTGSMPVIIFPDGREERIRRRGSSSILEGKKILKLGAKLRIQVLVSEMMSIHPESGYSESVQMLRPHLLVITNVRLDHLAQMGSSREDIGRCFAASIPERTTVFLPQEEFFPLFQETAEKLNSKLIKVKRDSLEEYSQLKNLPFFELKENISLALAVADFLGINRETAFRGMVKVQPDFGSLKIWSADLGLPPRSWYFVSCFAANDPKSTRLALYRLWKKIFLDGKKIIGLLNLRRDRGDRTLQWLKALQEGVFPEFQKLYIIGFHGRALKRKLELSSKTTLIHLKKQSSEKIMAQLLEEERQGAVVVGMGNMGVAGKELVEYWESIGKPYDL